MYGLVSEGEPFHVFARRENVGTGGLVIRFECKEGMGILGIRKSGRTDPAPSAAYEEEEIEPASLRAGRFVHVLPSGQRQSYALSRISADVANRMPYDRWVELKPHTEYGFRYLVAPDTELDGTVASVQIPPAGPPTVLLDLPDSVPQFELPPVKEPTGPIPPAPTDRPPTFGGAISLPPAPPVVVAPPPRKEPGFSGESATTLPPAQTPMTPALADSALRMLSKEVAIEHLKSEMQKVHTLQHRITELEDILRRSRLRERDLIDLLAKWEA